MGTRCQASHDANAHAMTTATAMRANDHRFRSAAMNPQTESVVRIAVTVIAIATVSWRSHRRSIGPRWRTRRRPASG